MSTEAEILAVSTAWDEGLVANDAEAVASYMADDWVYVGPDGPTTKTDLIGRIAAGQLVHNSMETIGPIRVAVHDDTVVVTARRASSGVWQGVPYVADEWVSEVFLRLKGRWLCVLSHRCPAEAG